MKEQVMLNRVCAECGEPIVVTHQTAGDIIYYQKKTYHSKCFGKLCKGKRRKAGDKWDKALQDFDTIRSKSNAHFNDLLIRDELYIFIMEQYKIEVIPSFVWQRLNEIFSGTYKGMTKGIPPSHLLDMWRRYIRKLNKIAAENTVKGKTFNTDMRIRYDLAVLINKYDSYLKWREKQKILAAEQQRKMLERNKSFIDIKTIKTKSKEHCEQNIENEMTGLVDDIFN